MQTRTFATGDDLRAERARHRLTAEAVARELGLSRQRISAIEALYRVPARQVYRYVDAVRRLVDERGG